MSHTTKAMTVEEFKAEVTAKAAPKRPTFREVGRDGWTDLADICDHVLDGAKRPESKKGPHYIDAGTPGGYYLIGKYDCNTGIATFFDRK